MRRLALTTLAAAALSLLACKGPCEELGAKLCECNGAGTTRDACEKAVEAELEASNPGGAVEDLCERKLDSCDAPTGARFCEWLETSCGRASCGLSSDDPADPGVCAPASE